MGLLANLLLLPVKGPADGALWVARKIAEAAESERNDPAALRAALREAERRLLDGSLSEEAYDEIEDDILRRLKAAAP